jgi:hypothetical protein
MKAAKREGVNALMGQSGNMPGRESGNEEERLVA